MKFVGAACVLVTLLISESLCDVQQEIFECKKGVPYIENQCNRCHCIADKEFVCNIRRCNGDRNKGLENCAPNGSTWQENCNKCWCTNIGTVCTNYKCTN